MKFKKLFYLSIFLIMLLGLAYIFLQRPLGLIVWDRYYYEADEFLIFMNEIEKLPPRYNLGKIMFEIIFIIYDVSFFGFTLDKNLFCSIPQKEQLLENVIDSYKRIGLYNVDLKAENQELYEAIYVTKMPNHLINIAKGRLSVCGK